MKAHEHLWLRKSEPVSVVGQRFRYQGKAPPPPSSLGLMLIEDSSLESSNIEILLQPHLCTYTHGELHQAGILTYHHFYSGHGLTIPVFINSFIHTTIYLTFMEGVLCDPRVKITHTHTHNIHCHLCPLTQGTHPLAPFLSSP